MTILDEIMTHKRDEVGRALTVCSRADMASRAEAVAESPRGFRRALIESEPPRIIAELKRCSPSRGVLRVDFDLVSCAKAYADGGAAALSVLTDERYFGGHLDFLAQARKCVDLPLLRKDFVVDTYQIDEARAGGADAVLLIVSTLAPTQLADLQRHARDRALDVLVEVHDEDQLETALAAGADLVGINNRDLRDFTVDLGVTERLTTRIPEGVVVVAESGIFTTEDVDRLARAGAHAFLVGESLMRQDDPGLALRNLRGSV